MRTRKILKTIGISIIAIFINQNIDAQSFQGLDEAPHDISYYRKSKVTPPLVKVIYGRPHKTNKKVFGDMIAYGKIWRTGANEATEVKFYRDIIFGGVKVPAGEYALYTIPGEKEWEIILSTNLDVLGAFQYDPVFDIARVTVPSSKAEELDVFSIAFKEKKDIIQMVLGWDTTRVRIPIAFANQDEYAKL